MKDIEKYKERILNLRNENIKLKKLLEKEKEKNNDLEQIIKNKNLDIDKIIKYIFEKGNNKVIPFNAIMKKKENKNKRKEECIKIIHKLKLENPDIFVKDIIKILGISKTTYYNYNLNWL